MQELMRAQIAYFGIQPLEQESGSPRVGREALSDKSAFHIPDWWRPSDAMFRAQGLGLQGSNEGFRV